MILTGTEITRRVGSGEIVLRPFSPSQVNPNSYNYRLGSQLLVAKEGSLTSDKMAWSEVDLPQSGYVLRPGCFYLGHTREVIGSSEFAMRLIGRSSIGRLGLFLQVSADLGHTGSCHHWTLELVPTIPIRVHPGMIIGQVSFWTNLGEVEHPFVERYRRFDRPTPRLDALTPGGQQ